MSDWDAAVSKIAGVVGQDFRAALAEADEAQGRTYYDAAVDQAAAEAYYEGVDLNGLGDLVVSTHREQPSYKPSLELYPWVDLQPDGKIKSIYTGETFEPQELIRADFAVLQQRVARMSEMHMLGDGDPTSKQAEIESEIEAQLPFNCEHVVPQSWFGKSEPMRGDLHHLFACESRCNSFRGNTPFNEFADFPTPDPADGVEGLDAMRTDCGKSASDGFEPAHGKGAAARAAFYFRLRYLDQISPEEMAADRWEVLTTWHEQDPVNVWEQHRNAAIFQRQGNRNPFIDHPEWLLSVTA